MSVINETLKKVKRTDKAEEPAKKKDSGSAVSLFLGIGVLTLVGLALGFYISWQSEKKVSEELREQVSSQNEALAEKDVQLTELAQDKTNLEQALNAKIADLESQLTSGQENEKSLSQKIQALEEELDSKDQAISHFNDKIQTLEAAKQSIPALPSKQS